MEIEKNDYVEGGRDQLVRIATWALAIIIPVAIVYLRAKMQPYQSPDFQYFLSQWFAHLRENGTDAFRETFSDYNMPYLYMLLAGAKLNLGPLLTVKLISNAFDVLLAFAVFRLVAFYKGRYMGVGAAFAIMVYPSVWMNSAAWGQSDSMFMALCVLSLNSWVRGHQRYSWLWAGVAFSLKFQTIFFLPFIGLAWLLHRRRDWLALLFFLIAPVVALVPAWLWGAPLKSLLLIYYGQSQQGFLSNSNGFWRMLTGGEVSPGAIASAAIVLAAVCLFGYYLLVFYRHGWTADPSRLIATAATIALMLPYLLPGMRDRYYFAGEILVIVFAFIKPSRWWLPLMVALAVFPTYPGQLLRVPLPLGVGFWALWMGVVIAILVRESVGPIPSTTPGQGQTTGEEPSLQPRRQEAAAEPATAAQ